MKVDENFTCKSLDLICECIWSRAKNSHDSSGCALDKRAESGRVCSEGLCKCFEACREKNRRVGNHWVIIV